MLFRSKYAARLSKGRPFLNVTLLLPVQQNTSPWTSANNTGKQAINRQQTQRTIEVHDTLQKIFAIVLCVCVFCTTNIFLMCHL